MEAEESNPRKLSLARRRARSTEAAHATVAIEGSLRESLGSVGRFMPFMRIEYDSGFEFCPECGPPLDREFQAAAGEKRKGMTTLFCDVVGFTASPEAAFTLR